MPSDHGPPHSLISSWSRCTLLCIALHSTRPHLNHTELRASRPYNGTLHAGLRASEPNADARIGTIEIFASKSNEGLCIKSIQMYSHQNQTKMCNAYQDHTLCNVHASKPSNSGRIRKPAAVHLAHQKHTGRRASHPAHPGLRVAIDHNNALHASQCQNVQFPIVQFQICSL